MHSLARIKAEIEERGPDPSHVAQLLNYIDSGQQASEFAGFLLSNLTDGEKGSTVNRWIRLNAEDFIRHLKER